MLAREEQLEKASLPIEVTPAGIVTLARERQFLKT